MKKGKSVMKKVVSLTLSFVLVAVIVMTLPQSALRVQALGDNPKDGNVAEVRSGEIMNTNHGMVEKNYGTINTNNGEVKNN